MLYIIENSFDEFEDDLKRYYPKRASKRNYKPKRACIGNLSVKRRLHKYIYKLMKV